MSERISEILDVLRDVANHFSPAMSERDVRELRKNALARIARERSILPTTVSDKFRRQLSPAINGTVEFDRALFRWLDSGATELQLVLEQAAARSGEAAVVRAFFDDKSLGKQVEADLAALKEEEGLVEGAKKARLVSYFERNPALRVAAIEIHGTKCKVCGFDFEAFYGAHGKNYIEVHHLIPISTLVEPSAINPESDLTVLCSNCHRMVHRKRDAPLSIEELLNLVQSARHA